MTDVDFFTEYSFYYSFILSFILSIWPFGIRIVLKYCRGHFTNESHMETLLPYFTLLVSFVFLNMHHIWYSQCNPICVFLISPVIYEECCNNM